MRLCALCVLALTILPSAAAQVAPQELSALAASFPAADGQVRAAVFFGLPLRGVPGSLRATARLLPDAPGPLDAVDAFEVEATLEADDLDGRRLLQVYGDLVAPPGRYRLALAMQAGEVQARAEYPLTLEAAPADRPTVQPPLLLDDEGLVAAFYELADQASVRQPPANYPFIAAGERFVPDISPRLGEDVPRSRVCLIGRGLTGEKTFLETGLIAADGTLLSKERLAMVSSDTGETGYETLCLGLDTQSLPAGLYQLNVTLHDFERRTSERSELPFEIVTD